MRYRGHRHICKKLPAFNELFKRLRSEGFLARQNFSCCGSCAGYEITDYAWTKFQKTGKKYAGCVFYHKQDTDAMKSNGVCYLAYGDITHYEDKDTQVNLSTLSTLEVGNKVVDLCKELGLQCEWDGKELSRIKVVAAQ